MSLPFQTSEELFREVPDEEVQKIRALCTDKAYAAGTSVFCEGDPADALFIVRTGLVKLVSVSEKGTYSILHILRRGNVFGELILSKGFRPFTAVAVTDATLTVLARKHLLDLLSSLPGFARAFSRMLSTRLLQVERGFAGVLNAWAYHRLARELLQLAEELGVETSGGTLIPLHLTHEDLSNLIGTARETVTIQLQKFEEMGFIRRKGRQIIVDRPRLADYLSVEEA